LKAEAWSSNSVTLLRGSGVTSSRSKLATRMASLAIARIGRERRLPSRIATITATAIAPSPSRADPMTRSISSLI
jgi:hypothetical protein